MDGAFVAVKVKHGFISVTDVVTCSVEHARERAYKAAQARSCWSQNDGM